MELSDFIGNTDGKLVHKWNHYFELYDRYLSKFKNQNIRILEIGVSLGGSLRMWRNYFGKDSFIVGMDINPQCIEHAGENIQIVIGNQNDKTDIDKLIEQYKNFDIIIDDGSHINEHVINSFTWLFPHLNNGGIYFIEDTHTSYMENYDGGFRKDGTSVEFTKNLIDHLTSYFYENPETNDKFYADTVSGIHYHDSVVVIEKDKREWTPFDIFCSDGKITNESVLGIKRKI